MCSSDLVEGTAKALPKRGFVLQGRFPIRVRVLDEIPYSEFANQSVEEVMESVRNRFAHELGEPTGIEPPVARDGTGR